MTKLNIENISPKKQLINPDYVDKNGKELQNKKNSIM